MPTSLILRTTSDPAMGSANDVVAEVPTGTLSRLLGWGAETPFVVSARLVRVPQTSMGTRFVEGEYPSAQLGGAALSRCRVLTAEPAMGGLIPVTDGQSVDVQLGQVLPIL